MKKSILDSYKQLKTRVGREGRYGGYKVVDIEDEGITRNVIEMPINDAMSQGIEPLLSEKDEPINAGVVKEWDRLTPVIRDALIMLREDGAITLIPKIDKVISYRNTNPSDFDINPLSKTYLQPASIYITGSNHTFEQKEFIYMMHGGNEEYKEMHYKGLSVLELVRDSVSRYINSLDTTTGILSQLNQDVLKFDGLHDKLSGNEIEEVMERVETIARLKSNYSLLLIDGEDDYVSVNKSLSGADKVIYSNALDICAIAKIPFSRLFGKGTTGLNSSGDTELKLYYDTVVSSIQHLAEKIFNILTEDKYKDSYYFPELYSKDKKEEAETFKINGEIILKLIEIDLINEEQAKIILNLE